MNQSELTYVELTSILDKSLIAATVGDILRSILVISLTAWLAILVAALFIELVVRRQPVQKSLP